MDDTSAALQVGMRPHRTLSMFILHCTIEKTESSCDVAQEQHQVSVLLPSADSHVAGEMDDTSAALQAGMSPTQDIEHVSPAIQYTSNTKYVHCCQC
jgi:hypothetical protein